MTHMDWWCIPPIYGKSLGTVYDCFTNMSFIGFELVEMGLKHAEIPYFIIKHVERTIIIDFYWDFI